MATELRGFDLPFIAAADLSALQFTLVKYDTTARQVAAATAKTDDLVGVLQNKPNAAGKPATVRTHGFTKLKAGAAVSVGNMLMCTTGGKVIPLASVSDGGEVWYVGVALTACSNDGEFITVHLNIHRDLVGAAIP